MALLVYRDTGNEIVHRAFQRRIDIGTDPDGGLCFPAGEERRRVLITRAEVTKTPVLVPLARDGGPVRVNGLPVAGLRVLHHGDRLELRGHEAVYWEVVLRPVEEGEGPARPCPVCRSLLRPGQPVVECPRCHVVQHRRCWFGIPRCPTYGCLYPILQTVWRALSPPARFERLESGSPLVKEGRRCTAGSRRDRGPYSEPDVVIYCPQCEEPFHAPCWLERKSCPSPSCGYSVAALVDCAFTPGRDESRNPPPRPA